MAVIGTTEAMKKFHIGSRTTIFSLFRTKGSPAFRVGKNWVVDEDDFKKFLQKQSEQFKF